MAFNRDTLEFLFDVMSEPYTLPKTEYESKKENTNPNSDAAVTKVLNLQFFMEKLFARHEHQEIDEVEECLANIKAALIYKGIDFAIIFAEEEEIKKEPVRKAATKKTQDEKRAEAKAKAEAAKKKA